MNKNVLSSDITKKYGFRANKLENLCVCGIACMNTTKGTQKWNYMLHNIPNPQFVLGNGSKKVPFAFVRVAGFSSKKYSACQLGANRLANSTLNK